MQASIIISTYNSPLWLEKVLLGFSIQTINDFEIIIADDGSTDETKLMLKKISSETTLLITHVWHKDDGFQKTKILNKAILATKSDYCIFTDGDCIPRNDFVETHLKFRRKNSFLSGGYFKLPLSISNRIKKQDIMSQHCFELKWLTERGLKTSLKNLKLASSSFLPMLLNSLTTTKQSWNGHNASTWKSKILEINGFNNDMKYGGEDREFGERLVNLGVKPIQIRYYAICVHLEHSKGYINQKAIEKNNEIRRHTKINKVIKTQKGLSTL